MVIIKREMSFISAISIIHQQKIRYMDEHDDFDEVAEAYNMAINALKFQERAEDLYDMACKRCDKQRETDPPSVIAYNLGRLSALGDVTGHTAQSFSGD